MKSKTALVLATVVLLAGFAYSQDPGCASCPRGCGNRGPVIPEGFEARFERLDSMTVAVIAATGPYEASGMKLGELLGWLGKAKVAMAGAPFAVYFDDPASTPAESTRFEVAVPVPAGTPSDDAAGVAVRPWGGIFVAKTLYVGPYAGLGPAYAALGAWVQASEYFIAGPAIEFYLNSPMEVPAESLKTEVCFQVLPKTE